MHGRQYLIDSVESANRKMLSANDLNIAQTLNSFLFYLKNHITRIIFDKIV